MDKDHAVPSEVTEAVQDIRVNLLISVQSINEGYVNATYHERLMLLTKEVVAPLLEILRAVLISRPDNTRTRRNGIHADSACRVGAGKYIPALYPDLQVHVGCEGARC